MRDLTEHRVIQGNSQSIDAVGENSIELVVTSPPYPMVSMWDDIFGELNPAIETAQNNSNGTKMFELMHEELESVWEELLEVVCQGGIICINIGDATRTIDDRFTRYPNAAQITNYFTTQGAFPLPSIFWEKPTNSAAKFMGSGMIPPNAYPTQEHEHILIFRNGDCRDTFKNGDRYESAYFWEERNRWFSDNWEDIKGTTQTIENDHRDRSGAYPFDIPYRLINMFSIQGDAVLDPFWGTGTTTLAAMASARNSLGIELNEELVNDFKNSFTEDIKTIAESMCQQRIEKHLEFVSKRRKDGYSFEYSIHGTNVPVITSQEEQIQFPIIKNITPINDGYKLDHDQFQPQNLLPTNN